MKALAREPSERFGTARELAAALGRFLHDLPEPFDAATLERILAQAIGPGETPAPPAVHEQKTEAARDVRGRRSVLAVSLDLRGWDDLRRAGGGNGLARATLVSLGRVLGDIGYKNEDGYLFLCDRKDDMIISGGVNIYPAEIENVLLTHPKIADVAVFGIPHADWGEEVKAVVQPVSLDEAGPALEEELIEWCRQRISPLKCPRTVDFEALIRGRTGP